MNRRSFFSKLPLLGAALTSSAILTAAKLEPEPAYLLNIGAPICPECHFTLATSLDVDGSGNCIPGSEYLVVEHPSHPAFRCKLAGKKFKIQLNRLPVTLL